MIRVDVLGPLVVTNDGAPVDVGGPQPRAVLLSLVHHLGETVRFDTLIDTLWGDTPPRSARNSVQVKVSALRQAFGPSFELRTEPTGYLLAPGSVETDLAEFERLCTRAAALLNTDPTEAVLAASNALALWRDDPSVNLPDTELFRHRALMLNEQRTQTRANLIDAKLRLGQHVDTCAEAAALADEHPFREDLRGLHLLALYRSGRQTEALRAFRTTRELLVEELGVEPGPELQMLHRRILEQDPTLSLQTAEEAGGGNDDIRPDIRTDNLRAELDHFVTRPEVEQILGSLQPGHAITVLGTGGIGKSRCIGAVARQCRDSAQFTDGVWLIDLAPLPESATDIGPAVANAIGLGREVTMSPTESIIGYLTGRGALLVLDNCEHIAEATASFANAIIQARPDTAILAASRVRLSIHPGQTIVLDSLTDDAALDLLCRRVAEAGAGPFPIDDCADLCRLLDNYPLAIELAAARTTAMSAAEIVTRLAEQPALLRTRASATSASGPRQYADLTTALDWSLNQLTDRALDTLTRATVFVSDFDLAGAEAVLSTSDLSSIDVVDDLGELVEHHLITREHGPARFRILEPIRQHLRKSAPETTDLRYADYYLTFALTAAEGLVGADEASWWDRFRAELPHAREAIRWVAERADIERLDSVMEQLAVTTSICVFTTPGQWALDAWHTLGCDPGRSPGVALAAAAQLANLDQANECSKILDHVEPFLDTPRRRAASLHLRLRLDPANPGRAAALLDAATNCDDRVLIGIAKILGNDHDMLSYADAHGNPTLRVFARQMTSAFLPDKTSPEARANRLELYRIALESNNSHTITGGQMFMIAQHCHDLRPKPAGPLIVDMVERTSRLGSHSTIWNSVELVANALAMVGVDPFTAEKLWAAVSTASRPPLARAFRETRLPPMVEALLTQQELAAARAEGAKLSPDEAARLASKAGETMAAS